MINSEPGRIDERNFNMPATSPSAIVRVVVQGRLHGQLAENVWHMRSYIAGTPDNEIALNVRDNLTRSLRPHQSNEYTVLNIYAQEIFPVARDPFELPVAESGTVATESLPGAMAAVLTLRTGLAGRRNRGRKYIAGIPEENQAQGGLTTTAWGALVATCDAIRLWFNAGNGLNNMELGILHRSSGGAPVPLAATSFVPLTFMIPNQTLGTMRTRIPGHGA